MSTLFKRLVKFEDEDGAIQWGDLAQELGQQSLVGAKADVLTGSIEEGFVKSNVSKKIAKVS